jgi:hypothetical protein
MAIAVARSLLHGAHRRFAGDDFPKYSGIVASAGIKARHKDAWWLS